MGNSLNNHFNANIMTGDLMTLRDLRVQTFKERREGRLTKLPSAFYNRMGKLEKQIREVIENTKNDPNKFEKANSDIRKFMDMKLELHKHRERKLTDLAREKVNGQSPDTENAQKNEIEYLVALCKVIEDHRKKTLLSKNVKSTKIIDKIKEQESENIEIKETVMAVRSADGMDELSTTCKNQICMLKNNVITKMILDPQKVGLQKGNISDIQISSKEDAIKSFVTVLDDTATYCDSKGISDEDSNPNGATKNIAGIFNKEKNILGMMPHPERMIEIGRASCRERV